MSSGCGDVLSLADLQTTKKHQLFEAEVITGLQGGIAGGTPIDYATNQATGQTQKTLPAILRDAGFRPASFTFVTGGTLNVGDSDMAVLWPISGGGDGQYYIWKGAYPKTIPAASTPASTGGVSASGWLPLGDITLRAELASSGTGKGASLVYDAAKSSELANQTGTLGDALIGVKQPFTGSVGMTQHSKNAQTVHVADFGAVGDGIANDAPAINAAISWMKANGGGTLLFGVGTYLCGSSIDLRGAWVSLKGAGIRSTILKANFTGSEFINLYETAGERIASISLENMTIDGAGTVVRSVSMRDRHYANFTNVIFSGGVSASFYAIDSWLAVFTNCGFEQSNYACHLDGSNHRTQFTGCSFQLAKACCLIVRSNGTANDGNSALSFTNCDFESEYYNTQASGIDFQGTDAVFTGCYMGEQLSNHIFTVRSGSIRVTSGVAFFGHSPNGYLASLDGGRIIFEQTSINGGSYANMSILAQAAVSPGGKIALIGCTSNFPIGGDHPMIGDVAMSGIGVQKVFAPRLGIDYSPYGINITVSSNVSGSSQTVTATSSASNGVAGLRATLSDMQWRDGEKWSVIISYACNADFKVRVAASAGGSGTYIGALPNSGGSIKTAVLVGTTAVRTTATVIELYTDNPSVGSYLTLKDISFGDSRALGVDFGGNMGNMYKF